MLLENVIKENDVVSIKLVSGEEVIGKFIEETATAYNISKPAVLATGPQGIVLAPYVMTAEKTETISFLKTAVIVAPTRTQAATAGAYTEATSGIKKATALPENMSAPGLTV